MKHRKDAGGSVAGWLTSSLIGRRVGVEERENLWRRIGLLAVVGLVCAVFGLPLLLVSHRGAVVFEVGTGLMAVGGGLGAAAAFQSLVRLLGR